MAKRARGSVRPGQRRPIARRAAPSSAPAPTPAATPRPAGLTPTEAARAAELEAQLLADEREAQRVADQARARTRARADGSRETAPAGGLAVRAEAEYAYVARDVKDIVRIAAILLTVLFSLYILIDVAKVISVG